MRIAFVISALNAGGAQRVCATLCNEWARMGHDVHLVDFDEKGTGGHYALDPAVMVHELGVGCPSSGIVQFIRNNLRRVGAIRRTLQAIKPDATVAFMTEANVVTLLASLRQDWRILVSERVHPAHVPIGALRALMRRLTYPLADAVVLQTEIIRRYVEQKYGAKGYVVPNPVDTAVFYPAAAPSPAGGRRRIVAAGRLDPQKGFDLLIDSFARHAARHPDWDVHIFGEGGLESALRRQARETGLADRVFFPGVTGAIADELRRADIFVHASHYEGSPNVVIEALACGCPVVATDSPGATGELLQGGEYGRLIPCDNVDALAAALAELMSDDGARAALRRKAPAAVSDLAAATVAEEWIGLMQDSEARHVRHSRNP